MTTALDWLGSHAETGAKLAVMRTRMTRSFTFEAAHRLDWHAGRCKRLHGHHYRLEVSLEGCLDENGVIMDFDDLDLLVRDRLLGRWDHELLNDSVANPTAEVIAGEAWRVLGPPITARGLKLVSVKLWETPHSMVELLAE